MTAVTSKDDVPNEAAERILDLLYTGVGLGVLAVNKAQVARRNATAEGGILEGSSFAASMDELERVVNDPDTVGAVLEWLRQEAQNLDDRLDGIEDRIDEALGRLEPELPDTARQFVSGLRSLAAEQAAQIRASLGTTK